MGLKETWIDKIDGEDYVMAKDTNDIAHAIIDLEIEMGDVDAALDGIIAIQNKLIGGSGV